jgi:predicted enzyme related to lactoylglutathione lyase
VSEPLRLSGTVIFVSDVAKMANFYEVITSWSVLEGDKSFVRLGSDNQQLVIHAMRGVGDVGTTTMRVETPLKTVFTADDRSILDRVSAAGGHVLTKREFTLAGRTHVDVVDPEGNILQIVFPAS